jgi:hypothetical protein
MVVASKLFEGVVFGLATKITVVFLSQANSRTKTVMI